MNALYVVHLNTHNMLLRLLAVLYASTVQVPNIVCQTANIYHE